MALGIWTRFQSFLFGGAIAAAASKAVDAQLELARQKAWSMNLVQILQPGMLAGLVAQGAISMDKAQSIAKLNGYGPDAFNGFVQLALHAPEIAQGLELLRRQGSKDLGGGITNEEWDHILAKAGVENQYHQAIKTLVNQPLEAAEVAKAIHRGYLHYEAPGFVAPPTTPGKVPFYPQSPLDPFEQAAATGTSPEQLAVMVGNAGLPLGLHEMLSLLNRGKITSDDVQRGIANSNLQNQYMEVALDLARRLLTPHDYAENYLRGNITYDEMIAGGQLSGMNEPDMVQLYNVLGRSIPVHQIVTGLARGGKYREDLVDLKDPRYVEKLAALPWREGGFSDIEPPFIASLQRGNLRPEFYSLAYANRYTYPSYFVLRPLIQAGLIPEQQGTDLFEYEAWPPDLAKQVSAFYSGGGGTSTTSPSKSATTKAITEIEKQYVGGLLDKTQAVALLAKLGLAAAESDGVIAAMDVKKEAAAAPGPPPPANLAQLETEAKAAGYQVIPPPPKPPEFVTQLEAAGYTVVNPPSTTP